MSDQQYGVFFRDQGVTEYLLVAFDNEEAAIEDAARRDEQDYDAAVERHADEPDEYPEPSWEDYDGTCYVEPISHELADGASYELENGFAVVVQRS
jgi:hypothetical protein